MLFEEAVMLAERIRAQAMWRFLSLEYISGEIYTVFARNEVTGIKYELADQETWALVLDVNQRALLEH